MAAPQETEDKIGIFIPFCCVVHGSLRVIVEEKLLLDNCQKNTQLLQRHGM